MPRLEQASHITQILGFVPGTYCAYVLWDSRHPGGLPMNGKAAIASLIATLTLIAISVLLRSLGKRDGKNHPIEPPSPSLAVDHDLCIRFGEAWQKTDYITAHSRGLKLIPLFSQLQYDAFQLVTDISTLLKSLPKPSFDARKHERDYEGIDQGALEVADLFRPWEIQLASHYSSDIAPEIRRVIIEFGKIGHQDKYLERFKETISDDSDLRFIQIRLICLAHDLDGFTLKDRRNTEH